MIIAYSSPSPIPWLCFTARRICFVSVSLRTSDLVTLFDAQSHMNTPYLLQSPPPRTINPLSPPYPHPHKPSCQIYDQEEKWYRFLVSFELPSCASLLLDSAGIYFDRNEEQLGHSTNLRYDCSFGLQFIYIDLSVKHLWFRFKDIVVLSCHLYVNLLICLILIMIFTLSMKLTVGVRPSLACNGCDAYNLSRTTTGTLRRTVVLGLIHL